ncbi:MAG: hypothetical protein IPM81_12800 [Saprospirales bacterium]|nr:hypothetical protein [Saprospirales bacterium]
MGNKIFALLLLILPAPAFIAAQQAEQNWCGYTGNSEWLDWYQRNTGLFSTDGGPDTAWLYVPVTVHIVGTNTGTGYFPMDHAIRAVCEMNSLYSPARIRFFLLPGDAFRFHNNSEWFQHDYGVAENMIPEIISGIQNRLNAIVVSEAAGACGYSWKDAIVLAKGCSGSGDVTWAHEAGHHFSLPHTFRGWEHFSWDYAEPAPLKVNNRDVEKADGSNCFIGGDRFCDTDPDYLSDRWPCAADLRSEIIQRDPNNTPFRSDATLIMSYAHDGCASRFSTEQIAAMRANLQSIHDAYLEVDPAVDEMDDNVQVPLISPVDTAETVQFNHIELRWNKVAHAKYYMVEISKSATFSTRFFYDTVSDTSVTVTKGIPNNWKLYWRVRAANDWDICQPYDQAKIGVFRTQNLSATNELERSAIITLAPNPVVAGMPAILNIEADQAMGLTVSMCDAAGRVCYQQQYRLYSGENRFEIPTAQLSSGFYSVYLQNEKGATIKRLAVVE